MSRFAKEEVHASLQRLLGEELRDVRLRKGLSLKRVEEQSGGLFKASILGSYERGQRSISVQRLAELANFYGAPIEDILTKAREKGAIVAPVRPICVNLEKLKTATLPEKASLISYIAFIQSQRGDEQDRVIVLRNDDRQILANVLGTSPALVVERMQKLGLLEPVP